MSDPLSVTQTEISALDGSYPDCGSSEIPSRSPFRGVGLSVPQPPHEETRELQDFWRLQMDEVSALSPEELRNHCLPLARIKKIMKSDEDVRMISAEAPVLFSKACEIFILEITRRAWVQSEANKRRTLQRSDIASAITAADVFDFLVDIVPRDGTDRSGLVDAGSMETDSVPPTGLFPPAAAVSHFPYQGNHGVSRHGLGLEQPMMQTMFAHMHPFHHPATNVLPLNDANTASDCASGTEFGKQGDGNRSGE